jgi:histidine kinase/DNA gyrase B/HSP90-like ATPase
MLSRQAGPADQKQTDSTAARQPICRDGPPRVVTPVPVQDASFSYGKAFAEASNGPEIEAALYYCCLEAVQNASKRAGPAAHTRVRLIADTHPLHLEVQDDGPGFEPDDVRDGVGLQNMRDRLGAVGGRVTIASEPGHGTRITAMVPLTDASARSGPTASKPSTLPV